MAAKKNNKTVLVAPLDWGLGHATRCIPVIKVLLQHGCTVLIAASGPHQVLLQKEFPDLLFLPLPGYGIRYSKKAMLLTLALQLPKLSVTIRQENKWLQQAIVKYAIDAVISDNRYGLFSSKVPCIFITHQLQVQAPVAFKWLEKLVRNRLYRFIQPFSACWVPDAEPAATGLGGHMSHPAKLPDLPVKYIGWLTRFLPLPALATKKYQLLISLSGPEPQRTLLENLLLPQLADLNGKVMLVRGLPGNAENNSLSLVKKGIENITIANHLPGTGMQQAIAESEFFISRCGYSTLMDLQAVACRCIFIPTPGQTEQEYLGDRITQSKKALVLPQKNFRLNEAMQQAAAFPSFSEGNYENRLLETVIAEWLTSVYK